MRKLVYDGMRSSVASLIVPCPIVYPSGDVCISILHPPGEDSYGYEQAYERWLPIHTVTTIALSVISILSDPNDSSPANIDAAVSANVCMKFLVCLCTYIYMHVCLYVCV